MKFVIWGLPLHSHTHSYVHLAFARAAKYMNFETYWVPNEEASNSLIDENTIVLCCGVADNNLKKIKGAKYVLHNSNRQDLKDNNFINLQVYTHDVLKRKVVSLNNDLTFWEEETKTLYQPWATDLLPEEIKKNEPVIPSNTHKKINWIGSITTGEHGNINEIGEYSELCQNNEIEFCHVRLIDINENINLIRQSRHAPTLQGKWQVEKGYIPCRIFKNISYGCWSVTNSTTTANLLGLEICKNVEDVFSLGERFLTNGSKSMIQEKMSLIAENHTYVNRITNILSVFSKQ